MHAIHPARRSAAISKLRSRKSRRHVFGVGGTGGGLDDVHERVRRHRGPMIPQARSGGIESSTGMTFTRERLAVALAGLATLTVFGLGSSYGSRAATGADTFGYVSQAYLWLKGDLTLEQPLSREFPWPHPEQSLTPLGYRPGQVRHTIVPVYSPGIPLIMAAFDRVFGSCGPYSATPFFGALLVSGTFVLAYRLTWDAMIAALAALFMASSPAFLFNLMFPMSDIVTASLWTWAMALLTWPRASAALAAGAAAGLAVIVRPNLVPLAVPGAAAAALWVGGHASRSQRALRVVAFAAGIVPAALFVAAVNNALYGSPLQSGYGDTASLYALANLRTNVTQFAAWLLESESVLVVLAALPLAWKRLRANRLIDGSAWPIAASAAIAVGSYVIYLPFDQWWYLRFLLPAFPLLFLFLAVAITRLSLATSARSGAVLVVVSSCWVPGASRSWRRVIFSILAISSSDMLRSVNTSIARCRRTPLSSRCSTAAASATTPAV